MWFRQNRQHREHIRRFRKRSNVRQWAITLRLISNICLNTSWKWKICRNCVGKMKMQDYFPILDKFVRGMTFEHQLILAPFTTIMFLWFRTCFTTLITFNRKKMSFLYAMDQKLCNKEVKRFDSTQLFQAHFIFLSFHIHIWGWYLQW